MNRLPQNFHVMGPTHDLGQGHAVVLLNLSSGVLFHRSELANILALFAIRE